MKTILFENFIKICDDLIEQAETFHALIVRLKLNIKLWEVWNGRKYDAAAVALFMIQFLEQTKLLI